MSLAKNPFFDGDNDVDDETFLNHPRAGSSGFMLPQHSNAGTPSSGALSPEERHRQLLMKKKEIEERTVDSSNRSLGLLYESERVGVATGEELQSQKEQLMRTEGRLDEINNTLKQSERHLNGIKSVFGGIKNYIFAKSSGLPPPSATPTGQKLPQSSSDVSIGGSTKRSFFQPQPLENDRLDSLREENHPALRQRGLFDGGNTTSSSVDEVLDRNLDEMASGLSRLKGLALDLNAELEEHDDILNRLDDKSSHAGLKVTKQNKDMSKILEKK